MSEEKLQINFATMDQVKLYREINPNLTTVPSSGYRVVYFNSGQLIDDNAFPNQLIDLYTNGSATFQNLINLKRNLLIGEGLVPAMSGDTATQAFIDHENKYGETLNDIWARLCYDYSLFDTYTVQTVYNSLGQIVDVYHQDISTVRAVAQEDINDTHVDTWVLSNNWAKITNKQYRKWTVDTKGSPIKNFNPSSFALDGGRQLLYCNSYTPGNNWYTIPSYTSILGYVKLDLELQKYHLNKIQGGFFPNVIVSLVGNPDDEQKRDFVNKFKNKYVGSEGEKLLFLWSDDAATKPTIIPFNTGDEAEVFDLLNKITTQKICSGIGANPELAGIQTEGSSLGGDANKLSVSYNFFVETVIKPAQQQMLKSLNRIMKVNGLGELSVTTPPLNVDNNVNQNTVG